MARSTPLLLELACLALAIVLTGCTETMPQREASTCIHGDPGGSQRCQAKAYSLAF